MQYKISEAICEYLREPGTRNTEHGTLITKIYYWYIIPINRFYSCCDVDEWEVGEPLIEFFSAPLMPIIGFEFSES